MENEIKNKFHSQTWILVLAMVLVAGILVLALLRDRIVNHQQWTVSVIGRGTIEYQPDEATINLGVQVDRVAQADAALNQLNTKVDKVIKAIDDLGVERNNITTLAYSLYPQYDYVDGRQILAGYNASQQIKVKVSDIKSNNELLGQIISETTKAGVNQINSISFDIAEAENLKDQARLAALADARAKANVMASAAGVKLSKVVGWWENYISQPGMDNMYYGEGKGGGGIMMGETPAGTQEIIVEINLSYLIK